ITAFICNSPAYDNNPLQDICVAVNDFKAAVFVNGKICKDPKFATANDFFASGLNVSGTPGSGGASKFLSVDKIPGLNTLGISIGRIDLEPQGFLVPDSANFFKSRLFSKILYPGDVFVFPIGLSHFQYNVGNKKATYLAAFNSQNPGFVFIPNSIFGSNPPIPDDVLTQGFQLTITDFFSSSPVYAYDNNPLQDICVAVNDSQAAVFVNGKICKDPKFATANDFFASGLNVSGIVVPAIGGAAKFVDVDNMPGLNTLGISTGRVDLEPQRIVPFHIHPRATELITVLEGIFYYNVGKKKAVYLAAFNSQKPELIIIPNSIFASNPPIMDDVLAQGFQLSKTQIAELRRKFS
ncbi:hypothetical protein H5410_012834, partial [Solanum commersonii]